MAMNYNPVMRHGELEFILRRLYAMRRNERTGAFEGNVVDVELPAKAMFDEQFANKDYMGGGTSFAGDTINTMVNVTIGVPGTDRELLALFRGAPVVTHSNQYEQTVKAGARLYPAGIIAIGETKDDGTYRVVVPNFLPDNLGSTPGSGTETNTGTEREIAGKGFAWVNPSDTTERILYRYRGFDAGWEDYIGPVDSATFLAAMQELTANTPPGVPTALTLTAAARTLNAAWTAPAGANPAVTSYILQYRPTNSATWIQMSGVTDNATTKLKSLTASQSYDVRVAAVNAIGQGPFTAIATGTPT